MTDPSPSYEHLTWTTRFIICKRCASLVVLWRTDVHDKVCPGRFLEPFKLEARLDVKR